MEGSFFPWFDKIFEYAWQFVPRPYLVIWTCRGVRYRRGKKPVLVMPGLRWYWPLTTTVKIINITWRAEEFKSKPLMTLDGVTVSVGYTMVYKVTNPVRADSSCDNYEQQIGELAEAQLKPIIASHTYDQVREMNAKDPEEQGALDEALTLKAKPMTKPYGVKVAYCRLHTISRARVFYLTNDQI